MIRFDEAYICGQISRELSRIRRDAPDAETVRRWVAAQEAAETKNK